MQAEGEVQVAYQLIDKDLWTLGQPAWSEPMEFGARGEVVSLLAVNYQIYYTQNAALWFYGLALCSNPELYPMPLTFGLPEFLSDKALYGRVTELYRTVPVVGQLDAYQIKSAYIPLHGIVRPRRQIFIFNQVGLYTSATNARASCEVYYRSLRLPKAEKDAINLKYGKYRRI